MYGSRYVLTPNQANWVMSRVPDYSKKVGKSDLVIYTLTGIECLGCKSFSMSLFFFDTTRKPNKRNFPKGESCNFWYPLTYFKVKGEKIAEPGEMVGRGWADEDFKRGWADEFSDADQSDIKRSLVSIANWYENYIYVDDEGELREECWADDDNPYANMEDDLFESVKKAVLG